MTEIDVQDKKIFLRWFLKKYSMKRRESVWILNYLLSHDSILPYIKFTEEVEISCERGLVLRAEGEEGPPIQFYKSHTMTVDAEKAFHEIRMLPSTQKPFYIQLNFPGKAQSPEYYSILEDNPDFASREQAISKEAQVEVNLMLSQFDKDAILLQIDKALDSRDENLFNELTNILKAIY